MQEVFKLAMREWHTGICLVTAHTIDGAPIGMVCNSFASISLNPPLVSWAVDHGSSSITHWQQAQSFAVHVLERLKNPLDNPLIATFAQRGGDKFVGLTFELNEHGDPIFPELATRFDCTLFQRIPLGDHDLMVGRPTSITHP